MYPGRQIIQVLHQIIQVLHQIIKADHQILKALFSISFGVLSLVPNAGGEIRENLRGVLRSIIDEPRTALRVVNPRECQLNELSTAQGLRLEAIAVRLESIAIRLYLWNIQVNSSRSYSWNSLGI